MGSTAEVPRKRRTQAERSEEMRARLAKAAFEVIAERGHSAFRTAAVAAHAGVSQGAQVHHFATKDGLTLAALEYAFGEASEISARRLAAIPAGANPLPYLFADFRDFFLGQKFWVALDITIDASKDGAITDDIAKLVASHRAPVYAQWADILVKAGWSRADSEEIVRTAAALLAGVSMRSLWENVETYLDSMTARVEQMILATWPLPGAAAGPVKAKAARRKA
jgi:AcrR family transcriptional regulator